MIGAVFQFFDEVVEVRIGGNNCMFRTKQFGGAFVPIDGLRLEKAGVIKEHPDLKDRADWREEAIKRFKKHIKKMETEIQAMNYIINELKHAGYKPMYLQKDGHRPKKIE